ncbi:MAG TPA: MraY family glycosyltransferase [Anaerolineae bacterium]|nr:MraY family glycosyltransferase [Anaerolineae bacterium]
MNVGIYLVVFMGVLTLAVLGTPVARRVGLRMAMDQPDPTRKVHTVPTPRLGGVAIFLSTLIVTVLLGGFYNIQQLTGMLVCASFVSFLGFWDDRFTLSAWLKLAGQLAATGVLIATGVSVGVFPYAVLNWGVTVLWVVGLTNAINFLDNMDGLSAGIAAIAAGYFALICVFTGQYLVGALSVAVLAACIGFLVYNWNPTTIFMGDSGSLFLGFTLACIGIKLRFPANIPAVTWMVPILVLGLPIFDTTLVTISRLRAGLNPLTTPGVDHTSHRLTYAGLTRREAVLTLYVVAFLFGWVALFIMRATMWEAIPVGIALGLGGLYALWRLESPPFWDPSRRNRPKP